MAALAKFKVGEGGTTTRPAIVGLMERFRAHGARAMTIFRQEDESVAYLAVAGPLAGPEFRGVCDSLVVMGGEPVDPLIEGVESPFSDEPMYVSSGKPYSD